MTTPPDLPASELDAALAALRRGECIGLPTETVYGLAADALDPAAVRRIFELKGRPADHPVIVHLPDAAAMRDYAVDIPDAAWTLAKAFWPGPLTLILKRAPQVPAEVSGGQDTVGLRVPGHPLALELLRRFGRGLAAPSANRFGHISPTTAQHVRDEFGARLPVVLDGGPCAVGIESTIVDLSGGGARILRPGMIGEAALRGLLAQPGGTAGDRPTPRVSGALDKHYAPRAPLHLVARAEVEQADPQARALCLGQLPAGRSGISLGDRPERYARELYAALRALDNAERQPILVESPPQTPEWAAINDRLRRAAAGSGEG